jgi:methionyl aminopeptidase
MIYVRMPEEIEKIRESSRIVAEALELARTVVVPGVRTKEIDRKIAELIRDRGAVPSFLGYHDYPASTCISINEEVVHGIPGPRELRDGDIVGIDVGAYKKGFHGDGARTFAVGQVDAEARRLLEVTEAALMAGIAAIRVDARLG